MTTNTEVYVNEGLIELLFYDEFMEKIFATLTTFKYGYLRHMSRKTRLIETNTKCRLLLNEHTPEDVRKNIMWLVDENVTNNSETFYNNYFVAKDCLDAYTSQQSIENEDVVDEQCVNNVTLMCMGFLCLHDRLCSM